MEANTEGWAIGINELAVIAAVQGRQITHVEHLSTDGEDIFKLTPDLRTYTISELKHLFIN
jgi:hypothetical protein